MTLSTVRCLILGKAEIHTRGIRLTPESELQFGLAMYFCANAGRDLSRDEVARLFWPQNGIEAARHNLRQSLYRLRVLGVPVRSGAKSSVLETHLVDADFSPVVAEGAPASTYMRLVDVSVLPGYSPRFSRPFARWVEEFRGDVGAGIRRGLVRAISEMRARGRYADVERLCRFCLGLDPLNEEATLALAEAVALAGGKLEAVGMIDRYAGEVSRYPVDLRLPASLLRERISDRLIRRSQAAMELPMIGREEDVERVLAAFQRLKGNRSVSYIVHGAAGVGKTRLASECCRIAELQGARVLTIGTQPSSRTQALFAVSELVDGMLQLPGAIGCAPAALECLRGMSAPLSVKEPPMSLETDGEARFAMVRWSILDVLDAILSEGPLLIHVDDAHQLDAQSQLILQDGLRTHAERPLLLLLSMRDPDPSDAARFERLTSVSTVHELAPLSDESCDRLVHRFCAAYEEDLDAHTRERIIQLSGGNPFFLLELLKHRSDLMSDDLPVSVQALLEDRLMRLSPTGLTVLRAAAVLGLSSNVERLHRLVERKTSDVLAALTELHNAGMLSSHDTGTMVRHDTIRDAVLERTPTAARRLLHRRAAKVLGREVMKDGGVAELWECLHHWREAGTPGKAVPVALAVSKRLLRLGLVRDALPIFEEVEQVAVTVEAKATALVSQTHAARLQRDWEKLLVAAGRWRALYKSHSMPLPRHSTVELLEFEATWYAGSTATQRTPLLRCVVDQTSSESHRLAAAAIAIVVADNQCDRDTGLLIFEAVQSLHGRDRQSRLHRLLTDAVYHAAFGTLSEVSICLSELVALALDLNDPVTRAIQVRKACFGLFRYGDYKLAYDFLFDAYRTFQRLGLGQQAVICIETFGCHSSWAGDFQDARRWIDEITSFNTTEHSSRFSAAIECELRTILAFESGDQSLLPSSPLDTSVMGNGPTIRTRQNLLAISLARELSSGVSPDASTLSELANLHKAHREHGYQDFVAAVVCSGFCALNTEDKARAILADYVPDSRRELMPPIPSLRRVAGRLALDSALEHGATHAHIVPATYEAAR